MKGLVGGKVQSAVKGESAVKLFVGEKQEGSKYRSMKVLSGKVVPKASSLIARHNAPH